MKIYTKTGDKGTTSLYHPSERRTKCDPQICAVGDIDELNAQLGIVLTCCQPEYFKLIMDIQRDLFKVGTNMATPVPVPERIIIDTKLYEKLEDAIDLVQNTLPELTNFILPSGSLGSANFHMARAICRRAERSVVHAKHELIVDDFDNIIIYLNRLSDLLFVLARSENKLTNTEEIIV